MHRLRTGASGWLGFAVALPLLLASRAGGFAQDSFSPDDANAWAIRGLVNLPSDTAKALSDLAAPTWSKVPEGPDQTIGEILTQACGFQQPETRAYLEQRIVKLNLVEGLGTVVKPGQVVAVPFCLKISVNKPVTVQPGDNPAKILARDYGIAGPKSVQDFFEANSAKYASEDAFINRLKPGDQLVLPYASSQQVLFETAGPPQISGGPFGSVKDVIAGIENPQTRALMASNFATAGPAETAALVDAQDQVALFYIPSVDLASAPSGANCGGTPDQVATVADEAQFAGRMDAELKARDAFNGGDAEEPRATTIGLVDSGLGSVGDDFFLEKLFDKNVAEAGGKDNVDDDGNTFRDDIFGINLEARNGSLKPIVTDEDRAHGTEMAALALGGMTIGPMWNAARPHPLVRLKIVNFASRLPAGGLAPPNELPDAINYLNVEGAKIINLSLGTRSYLVFLDGMLSSLSAQTLFVVAAGNEPAGGQNLAVTELYPAIKGGSRGYANTVTVGASNLSGARAYFSNYSSEFVDLLAPGCAVQTRDDSGKSVVTSGTSQATAITSFAAGVVHALGLEAPWQVKNRLIESVDYDPALADDAWASGRLNILKAVTLYHDVVDLHGTQEPILGALAKPEGLLQFCDVPLNIRRDMIRKIIPNLARASGTQIEFWTEKDKKLSKLSCKQKSSSGSIGDIVVDGDTEPGPDIGDVKEITLGNFVRRP